jgi:hypothetical protein
MMQRGCERDTEKLGKGINVKTCKGKEDRGRGRG